MSNKMGNFRVPAGSQSGGNPKKKRRTSTNTATPVNNPPNDMGPPSMMSGNPAGPGAPNNVGGSDTVFAGNPFDDSASSMSPGGQNMGMGGPGGPHKKLPKNLERQYFFEEYSQGDHADHSLR